MNETKESGQPIVSLIMPFFNNKELVGKMIDSILANTFEDWELLAIDDGSSEETLAYLSHYTADSRVKIIKRETTPKGAQTCRNLGMAHAQGQYWMFVDSDDYLTPACIGTRVEWIEKRQDLDFMVFPSAVYINDVFEPHAPEDIFGYNVHNDDLKGFARRELPFIVWSNIYRADSLRKAHLLWDTKLLSLQDADYNVHAIMAGLRYEYAYVAPDYGYRIRHSQGSVSAKICTPEHFKSNLYASVKFFKTYQERFGHKYDRFIYEGVLRLYNRVFSNGINKQYAVEMVRIVKKYNRFYGTIMALQVFSTLFLEKILPKKLARQIPMALYLFNLDKRKKNISKRIKPIF
ncbi:glycosyltransferase family 2 protein [Prevotella sp. P5-92]|uniref:glycosyltransferase family 2 protein n=1 Tax=Prevotella sp. P5-92 TaxID=2024222 RepID=UPI001303C736|nr:glycosyltransferase family 2 protein [Prevotella sp. P5-92]